MKKAMMILMAAALLLPLTLAAQPGPGNGQVCPMGRGMGMGMGMGAGQLHSQGRADMGPGGRGFGRQGDGVERLLMLADELQLTDAQRDQIKKMQTDFRLQMIDKDAAVDKAQVQLRSLMMDQNASEAEVGKLIDGVAKLRADVQKARFSHHMQMMGVLTADQTAKLQELRKTRMEQRQSGRRGWGQGQDRDDDENEDQG